MEFGLYTFGDLIAAPASGRKLTAQERLSEILACPHRVIQAEC